MIPLNRPPVGALFESIEDQKKHPAHESSVQALKEEQATGRISEKQQQIIEIMREFGHDMTAREIHLVMQQRNDPLIQGNQVSARMTELKEREIIYLADRRECKVTSKVTTSWRLKQL